MCFSMVGLWVRLWVRLWVGLWWLEARFYKGDPIAQKDLQSLRRVKSEMSREFVGVVGARLVANSCVDSRAWELVSWSMALSVVESTSGSAAWGDSSLK